MFCLTTATAAGWAERAADDFAAVLADHAHCEMKAASTALSLSARFFHAPQVVRALIALAHEELQHFEQVLDELEQRGVVLGAPPVDTYVAQLRKRSAATSNGNKRSILVDRLLIGALIEARSCERFQLLAEALRGRGQEREATLYEELMASEARHYTTLRQLALDAAAAAGVGETAVLQRLAQLAQIEGALNDELGERAAIHG